MPAPVTSGTYVTLPEAASLTGLSRTKLASMLATGDVEGEEVGDGEWLVNLASAKAQSRRHVPSSCEVYIPAAMAAKSR